MGPKLTVVPYGDELGMEELTQELLLSTRDKLLVFYSSPDQEK